MLVGISVVWRFGHVFKDRFYFLDSGRLGKVMGTKFEMKLVVEMVVGVAARVV